ncbi:hypothetical protein HWI79_806 [Cryptosporidium felis]|nr:hypothetical protein HWI79_806 [Cryptosporidium felis]
MESSTSRIRSLFGFGAPCCSKCISYGEKETLQCIDLDPPQIVNEISKIRNKNAVIGLDCNQKGHEEDLARDADNKVFGTEVIEPRSASVSERRIELDDTNAIPKLELGKEHTRAIKFEDFN